MELGNFYSLTFGRTGIHDPLLTLSCRVFSLIGQSIVVRKVAMRKPCSMAHCPVRKQIMAFDFFFLQWMKAPDLAELWLNLLGAWGFQNSDRAPSSCCPIFKEHLCMCVCVCGGDHRLQYLFNHPPELSRYLSWKLLIYGLVNVYYMQIITNWGINEQEGWHM